MTTRWGDNDLPGMISRRNDKVVIIILNKLFSVFINQEPNHSSQDDSHDKNRDQLILIVPSDDNEQGEYQKSGDNNAFPYAFHLKRRSSDNESRNNPKEKRRDHRNPRKLHDKHRNHIQDTCTDSQQNP